MPYSCCPKTLVVTCPAGSSLGHALDAIRNDPACAAEVKGSLDRAWIDREASFDQAMARQAEAHQSAISELEKRHAAELARQAEAFRKEMDSDELRALRDLQVACSDPEVAALLANKRAAKIAADEVAATRAEIARLRAKLGDG